MESKISKINIGPLKPRESIYPISDGYVPEKIYDLDLDMYLYPTGKMIYNHEKESGYYEYELIKPASNSKLVEKEGIKATIIDDTICIINVTGFTIPLFNMETKELNKIPPSGTIIKADRQLKETTKGREIVNKIKTLFSSDYQLVIIGDELTSRTYPGEILKTIPIRYGRYRPEEDGLMDAKSFITYLR